MVEVLKFAGCKAYGITFIEAITYAQKIINEWIEAAKDLGRIIPDPMGKFS